MQSWTLYRLGLFDGKQKVVSSVGEKPNGFLLDREDTLTKSSRVMDARKKFLGYLTLDWSFFSQSSSPRKYCPTTKTPNVEEGERKRTLVSTNWQIGITTVQYCIYRYFFVVRSSTVYVPFKEYGCGYVNEDYVAEVLVNWYVAGTRLGFRHGPFAFGTCQAWEKKKMIKKLWNQFLTLTNDRRSCIDSNK